jgi:hypothetical protein
MVEIAQEFNKFGIGCGAIKIDRLDGVFGRITSDVGIILCGIHK